MEFSPGGGDAVSHHDSYLGTSKPQSNGGAVKKHHQNLQVGRKSRRTSLALIWRTRWSCVSKEGKPTQGWTFLTEALCAVPKNGAEEGILLLMVMLQSSVQS